MRAYLDVDEIIRVARESGADAIYPGYGFLSENPELAEKAAAAGITFIGPPAAVLEMAGNKVTAKQHAVGAGVPVLRSTDASDDVDALVAQSAEIGFPIFVKAVAGGGGRGMRRVETADELPPALAEAILQSHEHVVLEGGLSEQNVLDAIRIASTMAGVGSLLRAMSLG